MKNQLSWNDLVFEKRNKEYGAYDLRSAYGGRVVIAFMVALITLALVMAFPFIKKFFTEEEHMVVEARPVKYTDLQQPPPIDMNEPPPQQIEVPPPIKEAIKFVPPKLTTQEVVETPPTIQELKDVQPANETTDGPGEVIFDQPVEAAVAEPAEDPNKVYMVVQQQPEFPGGVAAMMKFISQNMRYPPQARRIGTEGSVYVEFVVDHAGAIVGAKVLKGIGAGCDEEAMKVVQKMPLWKPGKQNGKAVNVRFVLPIKFVLG